MRRLINPPAAAALAAGLSLIAPAGLHAQPVQPAAGIYLANGVYTSVVAAGGATCPSVGDSITPLFTYPGPAKAGAAFRQTELTSGTFGIVTGTFPTTPAAGVTGWSGQVVEHFSTGGVQAAGFTATLQFNDAASFLATFNFTASYGGTASCQETIQLTLIKTGHL